MTRFKLDEHFGSRVQKNFIEGGFDAHTVRDEELQGSSDKKLFDICREESRCLVTLDLDFSDIIRFPPNPSPGIAILRPRKKFSNHIIQVLVQQLMIYAESNDIKNQLWIVEENKIRIRRRKNSPNPQDARKG